MNTSRHITYSIDERAKPSLRKKLLTYLNKNGDPNNLPPFLSRYFEPADAQGFFSLRDTPLASKAKFPAKEPKIEEQIHIPENSLVLRSTEDLEERIDEIRKMLDCVGGTAYNGHSIRILPFEREIPIDILKAILRLYPDSFLILNMNENNLRTMDLYDYTSCDVAVCGPGSLIKAQFKIIDDSIWVKDGIIDSTEAYHILSFKYFEKDTANAVKKALEIQD
jgi:hypothetical protein